MDTRGLPRRLDLRASEVRLASREKLSAVASANGTDIYGVNAKGSVTRLTPSGDWTFKPPSPARWVFPQPNGAVIVAGSEGSRTKLWLIHPTDDHIDGTASLPVVARGVRTQIGDRLYFTVDSGLIGVKTRDLSVLKSVRLKQPVISVVPTPSGDRLYVALRGSRKLNIIDRYTESVQGTVDLPGDASELRMDPLGQGLLVRPAGAGDSAWVVGVGSDRVQGTLHTAWRDDLPTYAPGSVIATVRGANVTLVNAVNLQDVQTIKGGAADFWYFVSWNGFRPRAADLDRPVTFGSGDSTNTDSAAPVANDSSTPQPASPQASRPTSTTPATATAPTSSAPKTPPVSTPAPAPSPPLRDASPTMIPLPPSLTPGHQNGYLVSFAAVLTPQKAAEVAAGITIGGVHPRVVPAQSGGTAIYRVVLGPYPTREAAEKVGKDSNRQYWVYEAPQ